VIDYAVARMEQALRDGHEKLNAELERMRQRKQQLEAELARLVNAIAEGQPSQAFMAAIGKREREFADHLAFSEDTRVNLAP
jgi:cell division protein FtsB